MIWFLVVILTLPSGAEARRIVGEAASAPECWHLQAQAAPSWPSARWECRYGSR